MFFPVFLTTKQYCQIFQRNDSQQGNKIRNTLLQKLEALLRGTHGKRKNFGTKLLSAIIIDIISLCSWQFCSEKGSASKLGSSRLSSHAHLIKLICALAKQDSLTPPPTPPPPPFQCACYNIIREGSGITNSRNDQH